MRMMSGKNAKRILFAWEMGGGLGHIATLTRLAEHWADKGIDLVLAIQDVSRAEGVIKNRNIKYVQAPLWLRVNRSSKSEQSVSYAQLLGKLGYRDRNGLKGLVKAWSSLYDLIEPDLLIVDHAPTAQLASKDYPFPTIQIGNSFTIPPVEYPMPAFLQDREISEQMLISMEQPVLDCVNAVLEDLGREKLPFLGALFSSGQALIGALTELDVFPRRCPEKVEYMGPIFSSSFGRRIDWPKAEGKKIFVYLYASYWDIDGVLASLAESGYCVIAYVAGLDDARVSHFQSANMEVVNTPVDLEYALEDCDLVVCHGGIGTLTQGLLKACPLLLLPRQVEQYMISLRIAAGGLGLYVEPGNKRTDYPGLIDRLLASKRITKNVKAFSTKYERYHRETQLDSLQALIEEYLTGQRGEAAKGQ
jgi:hypothetical protein